MHVALLHEEVEVLVMERAGYKVDSSFVSRSSCHHVETRSRPFDALAHNVGRIRVVRFLRVRVCEVCKGVRSTRPLCPSIVHEGWSLQPQNCDNWSLLIKGGASLCICLYSWRALRIRANGLDNASIRNGPYCDR